MTFEEYVQDWDGTKVKIANLVDQKKRMTADIDAEIAKLAATEMTMRKAIANNVVTSLGDNLKEGVNNWNMSNGRSLKLTHKVDRKIDEAQIAMAREEYAKVNDSDGVTFDQLLRVKYELAVAEFRKIEDKVGAALAVSRMLVSSTPAPVLELI